ncbi:MAG: BMC domain-containing protein [bacterium]|nr:BMC domain-containing protein [bacterium]
MRPAIGLLELSSIAVGILAGDAMVKRSPVEVIHAGTVHPGKYLVLVGGEVAHVEEALPAGREIGAAVLLDEIFLPDAHPQVAAALRGRRLAAGGEALGVVETRTVAAILGAADRGVKGADVALSELRVADDLGGKAYCLFDGTVAEVEAAVEAAASGLARPELLVSRVVIPRLHEEMAENLDASGEFIPRVRSGGEA